MSDEKTTQFQGIPPEWANQPPPQGFYGVPPINPMGYPGFMPPEVAQYHAQMHAMAMQQAAHHQAMIAAQQHMMPPQQVGPQQISR